MLRAKAKALSASWPTSTRRFGLSKTSEEEKEKDVNFQHQTKAFSLLPGSAAATRTASAPASRWPCRLASTSFHRDAGALSPKSWTSTASRRLKHSSPLQPEQTRKCSSHLCLDAGTLARGCRAPARLHAREWPRVQRPPQLRNHADNHSTVNRKWPPLNWSD